MKKLTILLASLGFAAAALPATANAQPYQNVAARQDNIGQRIEQGVRSGALTRAEAQRLRADYRALTTLEQRYRRGGLTIAERTDLNRRYDALSARVRSDRHDRQDRRGHRR